MKRKSLFTILAIALMFVLALSVLTACNKNNHEFSSDWKFDETNHWHECTTKNHTDTTEKLPHEFTWTEKTPAGVHTDKVEKGVCECGYETERTISGTATHTYGTEWTKDESGHWHDSTCDATAPTHDVMKSDFAAHTFDEGEVTKPADYGVVGEKKFTCTKCGYEKTETIDALGAKDNEIKLAEGKTLGKEYDGEVVSITKDDFVIEGNRVPTIMFMAKGADDNTYAATAPKNAGEYTVKATVKGTAEWKGGEITTTIIINKREITLPAGVFEVKLGENLESGKFGLTCINVAADTNNVVEWVTIGAPEAYYAIGIHTISATVLTVDNDNFELIRGGYNAVRFTVWNAPDSFYAGIQYLYTFSGSSEVLITTTIANGTVKKGDQILVNEIGKIITVNKIKKGTGTSATEVETATAGEEVGLYIEGATKAELNRGYMLSKPDTIIGYSKVTVTIRVFTKGEGGQNTPIQTGIKPNVVFADTFGEVTGEVTFPEGTTLLSGGEILEGVTINFQGKKVPAFVGRRFTLRVSGKTIAECIVTAVPNATRVRSGFMLGVPGTNVIEPIELGENTFAVNLNRSDLGEMLKNAKDTDTIELKFINGGKDIAKYTRTPGTGEGVYNEVGGRIVGSYLIVEFYKNTGSDPKLTGNNGEWVFTGDDIFIGIGVYITPAPASGT